MLISIITPVYNGGNTILETIESIRSQQGVDIEYIVVDGMSKDETVDIVSANRDVVDRYIREPDSGIYDAMNKGISRSVGDVVGIINADDKLVPDVLSTVALAFENSDVDFVYGNVDIISTQGNVVGSIEANERWVKGEISLLGDDWRFITPFPHPALFVRRQIYERLGMFDTRYKLCADHDFMARLIANGCLGEHIRMSLAQFRLGGASGQNLAIFDEDEAIAVSFGMSRWLARLNCYRARFARLRSQVLP